MAGEFSQHDFGQVTVRYTSGGAERLRFFASRLKWSRVVHVVLVADEREESLIRGLLAAFEVFGGCRWSRSGTTPRPSSWPARGT